MFGLSGVIGGDSQTVRSIPVDITWSPTDNRTRYIEDRFGIDLTTDPLLGGHQPAVTADRKIMIWLLGEVHGYHGDDGYVPRPSNIASTSLCASLYDEHGLDFVSRLNGEYVGVVYDQRNQQASVFLDRLGTQPVFYARPDNQLIISTQIQSLTAHPAIKGTFDHEYLFEFLTFRRVFGIHTPYGEVKKLPPASVTTYDLETATMTTEVFWQPVYRPQDKPLSFFVDRFKQTFTQVITEWVNPAYRYGLLLSGGSDSRLTLATMPDPVVAFHYSDWGNREFRTVEQVADTADARLEILRRDDQYYDELYRRNAMVSNFDGYFFQGYTAPFADQIRRNVDVLLSGLYADILFKNHAIPRKTFSLGRLGSLQTPFTKTIDSIDSFIDYLISSGGKSLPQPPSYLDIETDMQTILRDNISWDGDTIDHHGITYRSLDELLLCHDYYPFSNDTEVINTNTARQIVPYRNPFLDNRLIDLHLQIPIHRRARGNIIHHALADIEPALADIPHAATGLPLTYSNYAHYLGRNIIGLLDKYGPNRRPPEPYYTNGPWRNHTEFIREHDFVLRAITTNEPVLETIPCINTSDVYDTYTAHLNGTDFTTELLTLVTLLGLPTIRENHNCVTHRPENPRLKADGGTE